MTDARPRKKYETLFLFLYSRPAKCNELQFLSSFLEGTSALVSYLARAAITVTKERNGDSRLSKRLDTGLRIFAHRKANIQLA